MNAAIDWIAVDWGTTRLRVWAMAADGSVIDHLASDEGMGGLSRDQFQPALLALITPWLGAGPMPVLACGMVGSRQGWAEIPYCSVPAKPAELVPVEVADVDARLRLAILPGLSQSTPPEVLRGEETQIAGFLAERPDFDGVMCLTGTHSKWARISAGEVVSFQTAMTGEMFGLLAEQSVLRHCVSATNADPGQAFLDAVTDAVSAPERITQRLFGLRAESVLTGLAPATARARLSGLLIGIELAATRSYWLGQSIVLAGPPGQRAAYAAALRAQGVVAEERDTDPLTLAGLNQAARRLARATS